MPDRPHILILMPDQLRADALGCAGNPAIRTPNIDHIAREGVLFTHAYTVCPICMPARASFVDGLYPHNHRMWTNAGSLSPADETLFHHLQAHGYFVAYIGKSHFYPHKRGDHLRHHEDYMRARGIDYVHETTGPWATLYTDSYMTDEWQERGLLTAFRDDYKRRRATGPRAVWPSPLPTDAFLDSYIGRQAVAFIRSYEGRRPLCLFVGFGGPHEPWDAPEDYATMYDPETMPEAIPPEETPEWAPPYAAQRAREGRIEAMTDEDIRRIRANYYGKISLIDRWIGEILDALADRGWLDETMIIFWSDHGEMAGDHSRLHKSVFYESSVHVPLIIRHPEISGGRTIPALVEIIDVFPTLLDAIGAPSSSRCMGQSLWPILRGETVSHRDQVLSEIYAFGCYNYMIRTPRYKYAMDGDGQGYMLFDLEADPLEQRNLLGHPDARDIEEDLKIRLLHAITSCQTRFAPDGGEEVR